MTTDNFCFYLQNRLIQTSQTGGQQYSDTSPFSIPCTSPRRDVEAADKCFLNLSLTTNKTNEVAKIGACPLKPLPIVVNTIIIYG